MAELQDAQRMLEQAEQAALDGDLSSADELLRQAARIQEAELGPLHPDLANTLNNLAIVAEKTGRLADAETFYRRAAAIAAAALPPDHPMVAASRQNLDDFCYARGLATATPAVMTPSVQDSELGLDVFASEDAVGADQTPASRPSRDADFLAPSIPPSSDAPFSVIESPSNTADPDAVLPVPRRTSPMLALVVIGAVALAAVLVMTRPWSSPDSSPAATPAAAAGSAATATAPAAAPRGSVPSPAPAPSTTLEGSSAGATPRGVATPGQVTLAIAEVCRTFVTSGGNWRCDPAGAEVAPGPLVFYTRVRSARDGQVVHRWYRGDVLRKSVKLIIRANATEGYRTFSRQTVDGGAEWRVEVSSADGALLHQQRFTVR